MSEFLKLEKEERKSLIVNAGRKLNMREAIVEKDFWVCWLLEYLFTDFKYKDYICFKGGTSLSKVYNCIDRFSEDIDLVLDWSIVGIRKDEAYALRSNRQQEIFNKKINKKTEVVLKNKWIPIMEEDLSKKINEKFELYIDNSDLQTICFSYPRVYEESFILQIIRLEIGVLAEPFPSAWKKMRSYLAEAYSELYNNEFFQVNTVHIYRTFFEKITILHREANRVNGNYPVRYSRHFYDVYKMIQTGIAKNALESLKLLDRVVIFKEKFYSCHWAKYDEILIGYCKLMPDKKAMEVFKIDYKEMESMFFRDHPSFDEILYSLKKYELALNKRIKEERKFLSNERY